MSDKNIDYLKQALLNQQSDIVRISQMLEKLSGLTRSNSDSLVFLTDQITGLRATIQVIVEIVMAADGQVKSTFAEATSQMLARADLLRNQTLSETLRDIHRAASAPTRLTPEGKRAWLRVVESEPPSGEG